MENTLFYDKKTGWDRMSDAEQAAMMEYAEGYKAFLDEAKTERDAVRRLQAMAEANGFAAYTRGKEIHPGEKYYKINRNKAIILFVVGSDGMHSGINLSAAHLDAPRIDIRTVPLYEDNGMALFKTHYYGGIKKYQWTAIPLAMHGVVVKSDGTVIKVCIGEEAGDPQFTITDILPHLGQDQATKPLGTAFTGEDLNILIGSRPVRDEEAKDAYKLNIMRLLNEKYGIVEADLISAEIEFVPAFKAVDIGFDRSLVGAYGHDDRVCAYPALEAILNCKNPVQTVVTVLTDKEETGSDGNTGLNSEYMRYFIADLAQAEGEEPRHVLSKLSLIHI